MLAVTAENDNLSKICEKSLHSLCKKVYYGENVDKNRLVDLIFCTEDTIKSLNRDYRKKDAITDVLSFRFDDSDYLGEIYICVSRADEQRKEYGLTLDEEAQRLFIHGLFHLLGFDHETEDERIAMERCEKKYVDFEKE
ncbi:MAG: rRNA maturation RNase YbeY [Chitinivibrionia bacterium]|jgi:probable rRNA maturation factor|nr:rRNA maturation RNase YbeY [Chitinivibrionia bacterium]